MSADKYMKTVVKNTAGVTKSFAFLGPRGMRLAPNEIVTLRGDLIASLGVLANNSAKYRQFDALQRSLEDGLLQIRSLPAPIVFDADSSVPATIGVFDAAVTTSVVSYT